MKPACIALAILWGGASSVAVASTSPLHEIDHTAITADVCANVVVHANSAISATLRADERLARAIVRLRGNDLDDGSPTKRAALAELAQISAAVEEISGRGRDEIERLTALADGAPRDHARDLRVFASALDLALGRQFKMGADLDAFVESVDIRDVRGSSNDQNASLEPVESSRALVRSRGFGPPHPSFTPRPLGPFALARTTASDLEKRMSANERDETTASDHAEFAVTGC